ncbi:sigma-54-dependent Fis family transcriptional regulator [candidate division KSB1 bacterium]|nr:MAG: sigma-54-dependent Fis family transcriptional regulator [candidate division KSB1 bacterium]
MGSIASLLGHSEAMHGLRALIHQVAPTDISVLIIGESGTGKELVARSIHELSPRHAKPILTVNCGAIPQGIFESEIFGHERGSYTGADRQRTGYFEQADGGSLVLDEIGEMPLEAQVKLLRILEQGEFMRVGSSRTMKVNVRIIAATNVDLSAAVTRGRFRQDLYYRLKAVTIIVPPLRERREDILLLATHFAEQFSKRNRLSAPTLSSAAVKILQDQYWSGNVRELRNVVETALTLERGVSVLTEEHFRPHIHTAINPSNLPVQINRPPEALERELLLRTLLDLRREVGEVKSLLVTAMNQAQPASSDADSTRLKDLEREQILRVLEENNGNRRKTARDLGIGERTLYRKLKEYEIL